MSTPSCSNGIASSSVRPANREVFYARNETAVRHTRGLVETPSTCASPRGAFLKWANSLLQPNAHHIDSCAHSLPNLYVCGSLVVNHHAAPGLKAMVRRAATHLTCPLCCVANLFNNTLADKSNRNGCYAGIGLGALRNARGVRRLSEL